MLVFLELIVCLIPASRLTSSKKKSKSAESVASKAIHSFLEGSRRADFLFLQRSVTMGKYSLGFHVRSTV